MKERYRLVIYSPKNRDKWIIWNIDDDSFVGYTQWIP